MYYARCIVCGGDMEVTLLQRPGIANITLRYFLFLLGIFTISLGIAFATRSGLGTLPLSSLPYALSLGLKPTMGTFMMMLNLICFAGQWFMLRKDFPKPWLLQIPASFLFGWMTDFCNWLLADLDPNTYIMRLLFIAAGITIVALGLSIEVSANTIMLPVDGFVKAIVMTRGTNFGKTKVALDSTLVSLSIISSLLMLHSIEGVREGTILAALFTGTLSRVFTPIIGPMVPIPEKLSIPQTQNNHLEKMQEK